MIHYLHSPQLYDVRYLFERQIEESYREQATRYKAREV